MFAIFKLLIKLFVVFLLFVLFVGVFFGESSEEKAERLKRENERLITRVAQLTDEEKSVYEPKYQEYLAKYGDEAKARSEAMYFLDKQLKAKKD